jgi:hypothetical protein
LDKHRKEFFSSSVEDLKQNKNSNVPGNQRKDDHQLLADEQIKVQKENFEGFTQTVATTNMQQKLLKKSIRNLIPESEDEDSSDEQ